jgi:hypothetical protein
LIQSDPQFQKKVDGGSRGAPRVSPTRQCLVAALYHCRLCKGHISIPAFAKLVEQVVKIEYSHTSPPVYRSASGFEADLRRGLHRTDDNACEAAFAGLWLWRFEPREPDVDARVGYYCFAPPHSHLRIRPKRPDILIEWIDAAIESAGLTVEDCRKLYLAAPPKKT